VARGTASFLGRHGLSGSLAHVRAAAGHRFFSARPARDPYEVLGVSRQANDAEIKGRFRELAKKHHPDLNPNDKEAQLRMSEVTSAYDLLTDPHKRRKYDDQYGGAASAGDAYSQSSSSAWADPSQMYSEFRDVFGKGSFGRMGNPSMRTAATQNTRGEDVSASLELEFMDAMNGGSHDLQLSIRDTCGTCRGSGSRPGTATSTCPQCRGTGAMKVDRGITTYGLPCNRCHGSGQVLDHPCGGCKGEGVVSRNKTVSVRVPAGIKTGMELQLQGQGHAGIRGGRAGHLFVTVKVHGHDDFRHIDDDVHRDVWLSLKQILMGGQVTIDTLHGPTSISLPPSTEPGSTRVLQGKGPPRVSRSGNGNFVAHFLLRPPRSLTPRQIQLIEEFDEIERQQEQSGRGRRADQSM